MARTATGPIPPRQPIPVGERRTAPRQAMDALGVITEIDGDKRLEVAITNVSPHGCGFRSPVPFNPGATCTLRLGSGPLYLASTLEIVSSRERSDGCYDIGAKFA